MRPSNRPLRSLLAASSLLLLAAMIGCGDGKPPRKDRHHDDRMSAEATEAPSQSDTSDEGKKDKHKHDKDKRDEGAATNAASTASSDDGKKADKRTHDHTAKPTDVQWLLTMHGEEGKPQGVWGLTGEGELKGPVNAPLADGPAGPAPHDLRGLTPLPDGGFLAMNAFSKDTRILHFGPKDASGLYPFVGNFVALGPKNPAMVHAYQMAISADGQVYVSNQDTNTVTRYVGLGQPNAGEPLSPPPSLTHLADLAPGVVVPNATSSPEGVAEVRGIAFGPDGQLYVCDRTGSRVSVYDTTTGRRTKIVADAQNGLVHPIQVAFATDGMSMYIGDNGCDSIFKVTLATGAVETFVKKGEGGLKAPSALVIKGNWLYVGSRESKQILRYKLKDGKADDKPFAHLPDNPEFLLHLGD
jgi:DNA-binding beta-propeller fold protein YncE